jgi:LysM repeat protein
MGLIQFAKSVGRKLGFGDDEDKKVQGQGPQVGAHAEPTPEQVRELNDRRKAAALTKYVQEMGFQAEGFAVQVHDDKVTLTGTPRSQEEREKIVLLVGNHEGIGSVDDQMKVTQAVPEAVYYEVQKGDTLSKIAKHHYGDANKYPKIFEANKPMLKDPDHIYPGQRLRIPA